MRMVIAGNSKSDCDDLRRSALTAGLECAPQDCVNVTALSDRLRRGDVDMALLPVGMDVSATLTAAHGATAAGVPFFPICNSDDEPLLPSLFQAGAHGYLRRATFAGDLKNAIAELQDTAPATQWGHVIAVVGPQNGSGVTTIATNLAFAAAMRRQGTVALAQAASGPGDVATQLGLMPARGIQELANGWMRLTSQNLQQFLMFYPQGPSILANNQMEGLIQWTATGLRHLLGVLRSRFSTVVLDLGSATDEARREALRMADVIHIALRLDAPSIEAARTYLTAMVNRGVPRDRIGAIVNRHGQKGAWSWPRARAVLGVPVVEWIPDDPERANGALNARKPVVLFAPQAPIAASFHRLAARAIVRRVA